MPCPVPASAGTPSLGQQLCRPRLQRTGMCLTLRVMPEYFIDRVHVGELAGAVIHLASAGRESAASDADQHGQ